MDDVEAERVVDVVSERAAALDVLSYGVVDESVLVVALVRRR